ncbi:MAG: hypothetical protein HZA07_01840 [Nitrospirae bacterium]|nr:hypothetical protein [Nitrospirota bacterium]
MRPKKIVYDAVFEKKFEKYKRRLTKIERKRLKQNGCSRDNIQDEG